MLTKNEKTIRHLWLGLAIFNVLLPIAILLIIMPFDIDMMIAISISLIFTIPIFYINYYCAYKKFGTRFLKFSLGVEFMYLMKNFSKNPPSEMIVPLVLFAIWALLSLKLCEVNKNVKERELQNSEPYQNALLAFGSAATAVELDERFNHAVSEMPGHYKSLKKEYKAAKTTLPS